MPIHRVYSIVLAACLLLASVACPGADAPTAAGIVEGKCEIASGDTKTEYLTQIHCTPDFQALASTPLVANIPGARSVKVVLDTADKNAVYFQNSVLFKIHYEFASTHLSGGTRPLVPPLGQFNATEYYSPERRFILGAVTFYEGPKVWALEIAPYDTASAAMMTTLFRAVKQASFFGPGLFFHPTSDSVAAEAKNLPADIPIKTTDELYAGIDYQPLSLATGVGQLKFVKASALETADISYQNLLVLDSVPNDVSVVQGIVSEAFQTPLSHVNVLSQNRRTPNMGLRGAFTNPQLRALEGKLVELVVGASAWTIREVTQAEAEAFWKAHRPAAVTLPALDLSVTKLTDDVSITPEPGAGGSLRDAIRGAVPAFGGKAAHYSVLRRTANVPIQKAFGIPVYYYSQFMTQNGFFTRIDGFLADTTFRSDAKVRSQQLEALRTDILAAPIDGAFQDALRAKIAAEYPGHKIRFRTSTNSEDLDGFPCAGCYDSHTGDPTDWNNVLDAIRKTWATVWSFRTFEEREYYSVDHKSVGMALLVHNNFPDEEANGVAVTANPYDPSGVDPAFYVNVQKGGDVEVVAPPAGVSSDQFLYFFGSPNQPVSYLAHSSLISKGTTVLTASQVHQLGVALDAIHTRFSPAYGPAAGNQGFYGMDVEFKFDNEENPSAPATLYVKQARPYPGRGQ